MKRVKLLFIAALSLLSYNAVAQNTSCANMQAICTDSTTLYDLNFVTSGSIPTAPPGPDYDCVNPASNPAWFYFEIAAAGDIGMVLTCAQDIDYVMWGPFVDLADAQSRCGNMGQTGPPVIDCNALGTLNNNFPTITGAAVGEVYVLLITNFSNLPTTFELTQTSGLGGTDCSVVVPPCSGDVGTFNLTKNGAPTTSPISLCGTETFGIFSNGDYTLPADTISTANGGDSIYSAQLMFLLYTAMPIGSNPANDPGFSGAIIPSDTIIDANVLNSFILDSLNVNCDTVYFVPVSGDDGIGDNNNTVGVGDNGLINYDLDSNGCYSLGTPIQVIYNCPLSVNGNILCTATSNTININVNNGAGIVSAVNNGDGILSNSSIQPPSTASLSNLMHLDTFDLTFTDEAGCVDNLFGPFSIPQFVSVDLFPAADCNDQGFVAVEGDPLTGNGGIASITMTNNEDGIPIIEFNSVPFDTLQGDAGDGITITLTDAFGCTNEQTVSIPNALTELVVTTGSTAVSCHNGSDGTAFVTAEIIEVATGQPSGIPITGILWSSPTGNDFGGTAGDDSLANMESGTWFVTISYGVAPDDCQTTFSVIVENQLPLNLNSTVVGNAPCFGTALGSIAPVVLGGQEPYVVSVQDLAGTEFIPTGIGVANLLSAGTYIITATDDNGCTSSIDTVVEQPLQIDFTLSISNVDCYGDSTGAISLTNLVNGVAPFFFSWDLPGLPSQGDTSQVSGLPAGSYNVEIVDATGCPTSRDFVVTQSDSIGLSTTVRSSFCRTLGSQLGNGLVTAIGFGGTGTLTYLWTELNTGATTPTSTWAGKNPGGYQVLVTDLLGCTRTEFVQMDSVNPVADFIVTSNDFTAPDGFFEGTEPMDVNFENTSYFIVDSLDPNSLDGGSYEWSLNSTAETDLEQNWFIRAYEDDVDTVYEGEQTYLACLAATNFNGCVDTTCVEIISRADPEFTAPNVFTPGEDPNSLFFFPSKGIQDFSAIIYNRYGVKVFEFTEITDAWNGDNMSSGSPCSDGVYYYTYAAESTNGTKFEGQSTVTILRSK